MEPEAKHARRRTHRAHPLDWAQGWQGNVPTLLYVGPQSGWYKAPKWSEMQSFGEEDDGEPLGGIYVIGAPRSGLVKIGYSTNAYERLSTLQTGSPETLELIAVFDLDRSSEKVLHDRYQALRVRGEWFESSVLDRLLKDFVSSVL